jgi:hypothetical protein
MVTTSITLTNAAYVQITTGKELASVFHLSGGAVKYVQAAALPAIDAPHMAVTRLKQREQFAGLVGDTTTEYIFAIATTANGATISVTEKAA